MGFSVVLLLLLIIAAMVFTFAFLLPERRAANHGPFLRKVRDFLMMKELYLEKVLRGMYVFFTVLIFVLCVGGGILSPFLSPVKQSFGKVILGMLLGLLAGIVSAVILLFLIRLLYESAMLKVSLTKAAKSLDNKLSGGESRGNYEEPRRRSAAPAPRPVVCRRCGARFDPRRGYCPNCDERW